MHISMQYSENGSLKHIRRDTTPKPIRKLVTFPFPLTISTEIVRQPTRLIVIHDRPCNSRSSTFDIQHVLRRSPAKAAFVAPAKDGVHVALHPACAAHIARIARSPIWLC